MDYYSFNLDLTRTNLAKSYLPEQHEAFVEFMNRLDAGKPFPEGYRIPCDFKLGSRTPFPADAGLLDGSPAVSPRVQNIINQFAAEQVQFIQFDYGELGLDFNDVGGLRYPFAVPPGYAWLNVLNLVPCLDFIYGETLPRKPKWDMQTNQHTPRDPAPVLKEIRFQPEKAAGLHIFRPKEYFVHIYISSELHAALTAEKIIGLQYKPLTEVLTSTRQTHNKYEGFWPRNC